MWIYGKLRGIRKNGEWGESQGADRSQDQAEACRPCKRILFVSFSLGTVTNPLEILIKVVTKD